MPFVQDCTSKSLTVSIAQPNTTTCASLTRHVSVVCYQLLTLRTEIRGEPAELPIRLALTWGQSPLHAAEEDQASLFV